MTHAEHDTKADQQQQLSQSAQEALRESSPVRRERAAEGDLPVDEKGNIIPPRYEEGGVAGSTNETWQAGKPQSQAEVQSAGQPLPEEPGMEAE